MFECIPYASHNATHVEDVTLGQVYDGHLKTVVEEYCPGMRSGCSVLSASNITSFMEYLQKHCPTPKRDRESSSSGSDGTFHKFHSYEEAMDTFTLRPHTLQKFDPLDERLALPKKNSNEINFDVTGDFFDMGRVLEGVPEAWGTFEDTNPRNLFATVVVNLTAVCYIKAETLMQRSFRLQRLVNWLENQHIRVQVKALQTSQCGHLEIGVKKFEQYLDLDAVAVIGHTDFFRRLLFRFDEYSPTWQYGYGTPMQINKGNLKLPKRFAEEKGIFLFTDIQPTPEAVDAAFDLAEARILDVLENGFENLNLTF